MGEMINTLKIWIGKPEGKRVFMGDLGLAGNEIRNKS